MNFQFADLHCHPNLKAFGNSFSGKRTGKADVWRYAPPHAIQKIINATTGLTKFSQADFSTLSRGNVKLAFISFYPFEKGFFCNGGWNGPITAWLADKVTSIGYQRIRYLQKHQNYFADLCHEYQFMLTSNRKARVKGMDKNWRFVRSIKEIKESQLDTNTIAVIPTIEGAHVFNTGLSIHGRTTCREEVLENIKQIKQWEFPPLFITYAHNFDNELCGHSRSLEKLGSMVDQSVNLDTGFSPLGLAVLHELLSDNGGAPIWVDIKHMSLAGRKQYYTIIKEDYSSSVPIIVSHGAFTGCGYNRLPSTNFFSTSDINFFDEELVSIAQSQGIFGLQMDANRLATASFIKKSLRSCISKNAIKDSAKVVWKHLQHAAEVLDRHGLESWKTIAIGSDFDGTINPLNGVWTAESFPVLAQELLPLADGYLKQGKLEHHYNRWVTAEEIVIRFTFLNAFNFLERFFNR